MKTSQSPKSLDTLTMIIIPYFLSSTLMAGLFVITILMGRLFWKRTKA